MTVDRLNMDLLRLRPVFLGICLLYMVVNKTEAEDICWSTFGNFQYKVPTDRGGVSFSDAITACEQENTTLASVLTYEEDQFLQTFAMIQIGVPVWIGLYRKNENISWIDGSDTDYISRHYRRKSYEEGCVYMFQGWIEANCHDAELFYICKRKAIEANACPVTSTVMSVTEDTMTDTNNEVKQTGTKTNMLGKSTIYPYTQDTTYKSTEITFNSTDDIVTQTTAYEVRETIDVTSETDELFVTKETKNKTEGVTLSFGDITEGNVHDPNTETTVSLDETVVDSAHTDSGGEPIQSTTLASGNDREMMKDADETNRETITVSTDDSRTEKTFEDATEADKESTTPSWEVTFEELLKGMTVKEKPVYSTTEAENSAAIGSVSIFILLGIVFGVVLLDIGTIRNHVKIFQNNTKGFCSNCRKGKKAEQTDVLELVDIVNC